MGGLLSGLVGVVGNVVTGLANVIGSLGGLVF